MADAMAQLYQQVILDHSRARHWEAALSPYDADSFQVNPTCGGQVTLRLRLAHDDGGPRVEQVGWVGQGCSTSQASLSVLNDLVTGRTVHEVDTLNETFRELMHGRGDRKSTRLNSSHVAISYAVFCLKKKRKERHKHAKQTNAREDV